MNKKNETPASEVFSELFSDVKPLKQNTKFFRSPVKNKQEVTQKQLKIDTDCYFSDDYQPLLPSEGPIRWINPEADSYELKKLRRGDYVPELVLDLHGYRKAEAKLEIAGLIRECITNHYQCCNIIHGYGKGVLKEQIPLWLPQHPNVVAFHQAPKMWGGDAGLLVLIEIEEHAKR